MQKYSILQYFNNFNTSILQILQYFNTSILQINNTQPLFSNKHRGLWSYPLVLPQITTNYGPLYQILPFILKKKKENLNTTTLKLLFTYKL